MQPVLHYFLHFGFPFIIGYFFYQKNWIRVSLFFVSAILVDLDHLWARPLFDPCRCSIGFHPLHSYIAIAGYAILLLSPKTRVIGVGLLLHMVADGIDCLFIDLNCD